MLSPIKSLGDDALHAMLFASSPDILTRSAHEGSAARDASPVGGAGRFVSEYGTLSSNHRGERILTPPRAPASGVASSPGLRGFGGSPSDRLDRWMHSEREAQAREAARAERARFGSLMLSARRAQALEDTAASAALRRLRLAWEAWLSSGAPAPRAPAAWQRSLQHTHRRPAGGSRICCARASLARPQPSRGSQATQRRCTRRRPNGRRPSGIPWP